MDLEPPQVWSAVQVTDLEDAGFLQFVRLEGLGAAVHDERRELLGDTFDAFQVAARSRRLLARLCHLSATSQVSGSHHTDCGVTTHQLLRHTSY